MTNILSMSNVKAKFRVTYDSEGEDRFIVHKPDKLVYFNCAPNGLYVHNMENREITLLNTIKENKEGFSKRQIERAKEARRLYHIMGLPSVYDFKQLVRFNMLYNCPVNIDDINNAQEIYGTDIAV